MRCLLLPLLLLAQGPQEGPQPAGQEAQEAALPSASLGFVSKRQVYQWDRIIPLDISVDGLQVKSVFFNTRRIVKGPLRGAKFGTRARIEVVNTSNQSKNTGFAVAVFDEKDNLLGVASGGNIFGVVKSGKTTTFDLNFSQVKERLQRGAYFVISVELIN